MSYLNIRRNIMETYKNHLILLLAVLFIASCSNKQVKPSADAISGDDLSTVFYFEYDSSEIQSDAYDDLDANAEYIIQKTEENDDFLAIIEGHTDERGTIDYNFALGNRRAESIARYLRVKGIPTDRLRVESFGEEKPINSGSGESAWSENRRGEIVYPQ